MKNILVDTNIFLEILLDQENKSKCKKFLNKHISKLYISDFSLHSIGLILLNSKKEDLFNQFIEDVLPQVVLLSLPKDYYSSLLRNAKKYSLDFDDAYQTTIALYQEMTIATMDKDFLKVKNDIGVQFI